MCGKTWSSRVTDRMRISGIPLPSLVFGLMVCCVIPYSYATPQTSAPPEDQAKLVNAEAANTNEEAVSSDEFELFIGANPGTQPSLPSPASNGLQPSTNANKQPTVQAVPGMVFAPTEEPVIPANPAPFAVASPAPSETNEHLEFVPWWQERTLQPILSNKELACQFDLEQLIWLSMRYSPRVQSILIVPQIQRTETDVARGDFDPRRFGQSIYHNTSDPVGNTLTTGGPTRLNEQFWENSIGIRDRNTLGGKAEVSQMINGKSNNSLFFVPNQQADTKLSLNYTQPLLRGAGRFYNTSTIQLAGVKTQETIATANRELQNHTLDIINAYWELTLHRYLLAQSKIARERLILVKEKLENRAGFDLISSFISRARSAIANQQQQIEIAKANVKAKQALLRQLVNAPEIESTICQEMIPLTIPSLSIPGEILEDELWSAILYRGDIIAVQQTIEQAVIQRKVAKNELKATLDFMADSYVRGLRGDNQFLESWTNQFDAGRPSFSAGLVYQNPVGNRTAKANVRGRELEIQKLIYDYSNALKKARADIESVLEESKGTYAAAKASIDAIVSSQEEVSLNESKIDSFFGESVSVSNQLNDLLDSLGRLASAENQMADRQIRHMQALARIKYESGTLMTITAE